MINIWKLDSKIRNIYYSLYLSYFKITSLVMGNILSSDYSEIVSLIF